MTNKSADASERPLALSIDATCHLTGLGRTTIYKILSRGELEACVIGRRTLVTRRSIEALIERGIDRGKRGEPRG